MRVRITVAATLVTAVAVGVVGWLLVRTVENAQIRRLRDDVDANLDQVVARGCRRATIRPTPSRSPPPRRGSW